MDQRILGRLIVDKDDHISTAEVVFPSTQIYGNGQELGLANDLFLVLRQPWSDSFLRKDRAEELHYASFRVEQDTANSGSTRVSRGR